MPRMLFVQARKLELVRHSRTFLGVDDHPGPRPHGGNLHIRGKRGVGGWTRTRTRSWGRDGSEDVQEKLSSVGDQGWGIILSAPGTGGG